MDATDRYELMTRLVRLERELLFVRRKLTDQQTPTSLPAGSFQAVRVQVGAGEYAIPSVCVRQIIRYALPAPVQLPSAIKGVLTIAGEPIVVVDLGERLGFGTTVIDHETALVIATINDSMVALIIERVCDAIQLERAELHVPSDPLTSGACVAAIGTYAGRLVQVLDLDQLVPPAELELLTLSIESP
ncbi:MAG TPA: chemotaxis protein CheW [Polyangiaceae bacterium]|nr:chemotaxis protein CheW [Polyangiaceae bacterium]